MFALSTSWNSGRHPNGEDIVREIKELSFDEIELNFALTSHMVDGIARLQQKGLIRIISLHNYCPLPEGVKRSDASPDYFSLSSVDKEENERARIETAHTIDRAKKLGAKAVILHLGKVKMKRSCKTLIDLYKKELRGSGNYQKFCHEMIEERQSKSEEFLHMVLYSLKELSPYAKDQGIGLGIENRYYFEEIPSLDEIGEILDYFDKSGVFYWHDTGHAQNLENLGLARHEDYLQRYSNRMLGVHLHDIKGTQDHLAPLKGEFDFRILKPYFKKETLKVLEPHYPASGEEIRKGAEYLESLFG